MYLGNRLLTSLTFSIPTVSLKWHNDGLRTVYEELYYCNSRGEISVCGGGAGGFREEVREIPELVS